MTVPNETVMVFYDFLKHDTFQFYGRLIRVVVFHNYSSETLFYFYETHKFLTKKAILNDAQESSVKLRVLVDVLKLFIFVGVLTQAISDSSLRCYLGLQANSCNTFYFPNCSFEWVVPSTWSFLAQFVYVPIAYVVGGHLSPIHVTPLINPQLMVEHPPSSQKIRVSKRILMPRFRKIHISQFQNFKTLEKFQIV